MVYARHLKCRGACSMRVRFSPRPPKVKITMLISSIILKYLIFFLIGIFQDVLATYYYQTIAKEYPWRAGIFSMIVTLVNLLILYEILTGIENQVLSIVLVYAFGNGVGTFIVMKKHFVKRIFLRKKEKGDI